MGSLQPFAWDESERSHLDPCTQRTYYRAFTLQDTRYCIGDSVYLFPECDGMPLHLGRLEAAFEDCSPGASDSHCIEVRWFERVANLEAPSAAGPSRDRELVELEDTDVNPMGCLAGKAIIFRVHAYEEAEQLARITRDTEWFFCRGLFQQSTGEFVLYDAMPGMHAAPVPEDVGDSEEVRAAASAKARARDPAKDAPSKKKQKTKPGTPKGSALQQIGGAAPARKFDNDPGRQCVECGATQTPQWREGPAGSKTLCNACGVRYNRLRASRKNGIPKAMKPKGKGIKTGPKGGRLMHSVTPASTAPIPDQGLADPISHPHPWHDPLQQQPWSQPQQQQGSAAAGAGGRPQRQAALLAANRTAAYARTGAFPEDGAATAGQLEGSGSGFDDVSPNSSESAEELSLHAQRMGTSPSPCMERSGHGGEGLAGRRTKQLSVDTAAGGSLSAPMTSQPVVTACAASAAASLMAMGRQLEAGPSMGMNGAEQQVSNEVAEAAPSGVPPPGPSTAPAAAPGAASAAASQLRGVVLRAVGLCPDGAEDVGKLVTDCEALQEQLPEDVAGQLRRVAEQVDAAASDMVAADAALQAALQVVATCQRKMDSARERTVSLMDQLKACMSGALQQYGGTPHGTSGGASQPAGGGGQLYDVDSQPLVSAQPLQVNGSGGQKALLDARVSWSNIDNEHVSLLDSHLFGDAADSGASLLDVDGFGASVVKVRS